MARWTKGASLRAIVFSGGGAFGAYHAGAWRALEERGFRPDIVVGTSIGAIQAAAVARGCRAERIEQWWRDPRSNVFRWNWPPTSLGFLEQRALAARLDELVRELPQAHTGVRLMVTLTELPGTGIRAVADEQVTARVLLASCAFPFGYAPVRIAGRWYCDGGVFCRLPAALAAEAGATEIFTVDLLAAPPSRLLRAGLNAAVGLRRRLLRQPDLGVVSDPAIPVWRVEPRQPLGRLRDGIRWDLEKINRWIELGYTEAASTWELRERAIQASRPQAISPSAESAAPR